MRMRFYADFHIHSHFSLATSTQLVPEHIDRWGRIKGLRVVGTGDFTHPGWLDELKEKLEPAEPGLFRLRPDFKNRGDWGVAETPENSVRFLLTAEISSIYKKSGKVRKVHNVLFAPDFTTAEKIQRTLQSLEFNIVSDGRPILGMDSRDLLELSLGASADVFFVPAHIWTPWFSAMGEKSGFDSIQECYADLAGHIHAVETGLSSDPPMNRMVSSLDPYVLISNSDAHSPEKLGREANGFDTELSYSAITTALKNPAGGGFIGTLEFFPQEGKYHHDGHRKCGISWEPEETLRHGGICPKCGRRVTVGVLHRVHQLADRKQTDAMTGRVSFHSMIPLIEILSEIHGSGRTSKPVVADYAALVRKMGSEIAILLEYPVDEVKRAGGELVAEAVHRMRAGEVHIEAGYDGEYGKIRAFAEGETVSMRQSGLFGENPVLAEEKPGLRRKNGQSGKSENTIRENNRDLDRAPHDEPRGDSKYAVGTSGKGLPVVSSGSGGGGFPDDPFTGLTAEQEAATAHGDGPASVMAGPGTGKTRVLTGRIAHLIRDRAVQPERILALTFTNKAAGEIRVRVASVLSKTAGREHPLVCTFHAWGHSLLEEHAGVFGRTAQFTLFDADECLELLNSRVPSGGSGQALLAAVRRAKTDPASAESCLESDLSEALRWYESKLEFFNAFDLDDLIAKPVRLFREHPDALAEIRGRFDHMLVDETQDLDVCQSEWIRLFTSEETLPEARPPVLWVVGDPDQSIYGFRGASPEFIRRFGENYPGAAVYALTRSYRCPEAVLRASDRVLHGSEKPALKDGGGSPGTCAAQLHVRGVEPGVRIRIVRNASDRGEAEFVARTIERMAGGVRFFSMDSGIASGDEAEDYSFSDFAVLCRTARQFDAFHKSFRDHGIPVQTSDVEPFYRTEPWRAVLSVLKQAVRGQQPGAQITGFTLEKTEQDRLREILGAATARDALAWIASKSPDAMQAGRGHELERLLDLAGPFRTDIRGFVKAVTLGTGLDLVKPDIEAVALLTLHAAKGLEFSCVFIPGCEDGLIPYRLFGTEGCDVEEEQRLLYVGMTRAKKALILSHSDKRFLFGREWRLPRSPFLDTIGSELADVGTSPHSAPRRPEDPQMELF